MYLIIIQFRLINSTNPPNIISQIIANFNIQIFLLLQSLPYNHFIQYNCNILKSRDNQNILEAIIVHALTDIIKLERNDNEDTYYGKAMTKVYKRCWEIYGYPFSDGPQNILSRYPLLRMRLHTLSYWNEPIPARTQFENTV